MKKIKRLKKVFIYIKERPWVFLIPVLAVAVLLLSYFIYRFWLTQPAPEPAGPTEEIVEPQKNLTPRRLDGTLVEAGKENVYPVGVMIENHWEARPPSGLAKANLVYEVMTEGGITRFLAVFASGDEVEKIGPVRSARPYYLDWVSEFDALYMHCGGSDESLIDIKKYDINDLNEFYYGKYYWRSGRPRPHNIYTSSDFIRRALEARELDKEIPAYDSWIYKDEGGEEWHSRADKITVDYGKPEFLVEWSYNPETNDYARFVAEEKHADEDNSEIKAKNVVVQYVKMWTIDDYGRKKIETTGEGRAIIFRDGVVIDGTWKKEKRTSRTKFYDSTGDPATSSLNERGTSLGAGEIQFNRGTTWVEVVSKVHEVKWE